MAAHFGMCAAERRLAGRRTASGARLKRDVRAHMRPDRKTNLREQFESALRAYAARQWNDHEFFSRPLNNDDVAIEEGDSTDPSFPTYYALSRQIVSQIANKFVHALALCESPIERAMLCALSVTAYDLSLNVWFTANGFIFGERDDAGGDLCIQPQAQIGAYRVDFLLTYRELVPDFDRKVKVASGEKIPGSKVVAEQLIVECDGHDFHERTKEQARRDKQRDRALQQLGFRVFRYAGSEIWRDVFECAEECIKALGDAVGKKW